MDTGYLPILCFTKNQLNSILLLNMCQHIEIAGIGQNSVLKLYVFINLTNS